MNLFGFLTILVAATLLAGCADKTNKSERPASPISTSAPQAQQQQAIPSSNSQPVAASQDPDYLSRAQPRLQTIKLWLGTNEIAAEVAITRRQIETGMMWRTNMNEMDGMLFVFGSPSQVAFWMKNTLLPLSCAYIDPDGKVLETHPMQPRDLTPIKAETDQVQYVLEMNQGWFERHGVGPGTVIRSDRGTLRELFFR